MGSKDISDFYQGYGHLKLGVGIHHFRNYNFYVGFQISGLNLCNLVEHFVTSVDGIALSFGCTLTRARNLYVSTGSSASYNPASAEGRVLRISWWVSRCLGTWVDAWVGRWVVIKRSFGFAHFHVSYLGTPAYSKYIVKSLADKFYDGKGASAPRRVSFFLQRFQLKKYDFGWKSRKNTQSSKRTTKCFY